MGGVTPLARYQRDLPRSSSLGAKAAQLDALFHHRVARSVKKNGTVSYLGQRFEVPYELSGKPGRLVVDPHEGRVVGVEDEAGASLGAATVLDQIANQHHTRSKPDACAQATPDSPRSGPTWWRSPRSSITAEITTRRWTDMYLQPCGLRHPPLGKDIAEPWDDGALAQPIQRLNWLLQSPGLGLLTGEPGVGKTGALRSLTRALNPHRHLVLYQAETDFGRVDIYRGLARALGPEPS